MHYSYLILSFLIIFVCCLLLLCYLFAWSFVILFRAHKLSLDPICTHSFLSCGEDGLVNAYDVRTRDCRELVRFLRRGKKVPLHSVVHDPLSHGNIFALAGLDKHVKVYDQRYLGSEESLKPLHILCPSKLQRESHITCLAYSCQGELLATYSDDKVYLFDSPSSPSRANGGKNTDKNSDQQNHATSSDPEVSNNRGNAL